MCGQMTQRATPAVAVLLVGSSMSDRTKVMIQTQRDTLVLYVGFGG
jgi:hypothetical protein